MASLNLFLLLIFHPRSDSNELRHGQAATSCGSWIIVSGAKKERRCQDYTCAESSAHFACAWGC